MASPISNLTFLTLPPGGCNLWPGAAAGAVHSLHRGPRPGITPHLHTPNSTHPILLSPDRFTRPQEALRTRGFMELSAAALLPLLRSDNLCVDEIELIRAARSWARVGAVRGILGEPQGAEGGTGSRNPASRRLGGCSRHARAQCWLSQAVLERSVAEVAAPVVRELRLALLAPAELSALEEQNRREPFIPVRTRGTRLRSTPPRGDPERGARLCPVSSGQRGTAGLRGDPPSPVGGADRGGVEVSCPAERGCGPGSTVPPTEGDPAPGAPPLSGPALQVTQCRDLRGIPGPPDWTCPKLQLPTCSAVGAGFRCQQAAPSGSRKDCSQVPRPRRGCGESARPLPSRDGETQERGFLSPRAGALSCAGLL